MKKMASFPKFPALPKMPAGKQSLRGGEILATSEDRAAQGIEGTLAQRILYQELQKRQLRFDYLVEEPKGPILSFVIPREQIVIQVPETEAVSSLNGYNDILAYIYTVKQGLQYAEIAPWEAEVDPLYLEGRLDELVGKR